MSASFATATRRDLRRAVGEEALGVIEQHQRDVLILTAHVNALVASNATLTEQVSQHERALLAASRRLDKHSAAMAVLHVFVGRSFVDRVRWFFAGR